MNSFPRFELASIIEKHSWKSILLNMIYEGKVDPWDIDIDIVIDEFMERVKNMKKLELHIPGNLILATSILLKYKSLYLIENGNDVDREVEEIDVSTEPLNFTKRMKPSRPITLNELITVIEETIKTKVDEIVKSKVRRRNGVVVELPKINKEDVESRIKRIFSKLVELMDEYGTVRLEEILDEDERVKNVSNFLILLHMENEGYLFIKQEKIFGEVLLHINKERVIKGE